MMYVKLIKSMFKKLDLFPLYFTFSIKDNELKKTFGGGFFSVILIMITMFVCITNYLSFLSWDMG